jgi:hypothetical protein
MTAAEFKKKWARVTAKETSAYQSHFDDLCRLLRIAPPLEADPKGEFFCYQKRVVKDAELFTFDAAGKVADAGDSERGFADVWKKGCFAWEYKGKKKNLETAYTQLLRYREALENPPLLVVCDFDRYIIRTNFNGTVQEVHEFTNAQIDEPANWRILRALFSEPDFLKPQRTTAQVTETLAKQIADVAKSLQKRESRELADARTRAEMNFSQRKNLRIARFLNRVVFCFFAEDTGLLPKSLFSEIARSGLDDPMHFAETLETLFGVMATGGSFGRDKIRHFNGHLFEDSTVFELTEEELRTLAEAGEADWQFIEPSIMGTLFERALEPEQRSQLGAHYTSEADIKTLVEPVLMAPLRREWAALKGELAAAYVAGKGTPAQREKLAALQAKLAAVTVLDPACGSGNFLYVSLQLLLALEKEVVTYGAQLGFKFAPQVGVQQLRAIELNPYAFELAQVSVQIGFLQWRRDNGFDNDRSPVLQNLDGFQNEDALLVPHFRSKAKTLKEAQAGEHKGEDALKFYTEREWPKCDVIVGNPPFLGGKMLRRELGDAYVEALFYTFGERVRPEADLCCYWFEKAREQISRGECKRAGLLATQGIRGGANRDVLKSIKSTGDIFFAESDRDWILAGANVHVSMVGFDDGAETQRGLDGRAVAAIHANLAAASADITAAQRLCANGEIAFMGDTKGGAFDLTEEQAVAMLSEPNPHGWPNSDVLIPWVNGLDVTRRLRGMFTIDFGLERSAAESACYELPFAHIDQHVRPERVKNNRALYAKNWWRHVEPRPGMLKAIESLPRFLLTARVAKHRLFTWMKAPTLPDSQVFAFARDDDYFFGVLHSRFHETWARSQATQVRERESGLRYTPTSCFETFPFPHPDDTETHWLEIVSRLRAAHHHTDRSNVVDEDPPPRTVDEHRVGVADAAKELNDLRERWLNPPEWTQLHTLTFPGSAAGPWARYLDRASVDPQTGIGTVRYPRLEPRDAECAAKLNKRTLTNLYNERPAWLALAHAKLDAAVAAAYGWPPDLSDDEILSRLLELNLARAAAEGKPARKPLKRKPNPESESQIVMAEIQ